MKAHAPPCCALVAAGTLPRPRSSSGRDGCCSADNRSIIVYKDENNNGEKSLLGSVLIDEDFTVQDIRDEIRDVRAAPPMPRAMGLSEGVPTASAPCVMSSSASVARSSCRPCRADDRLCGLLQCLGQHDDFVLKKCAIPLHSPQQDHYRAVDLFRKREEYCPGHCPTITCTQVCTARHSRSHRCVAHSTTTTTQRCATNIARVHSAHLRTALVFFSHALNPTAPRVAWREISGS